MRGSLRPLAVVTAIALVFIAIVLAAAEAPANEHFQRTWQRTDQPVQNGAVARTWIWGPEGNTGELQEPYAEAPGGNRTVQYFDKSRMEINNPAGDPASPFYVTNGLLVVELMTGQLQTGNTQFEPHSPAAVNVAGDAGDPNSPTYADLAPLRSAPAVADGSVITQKIDGNGSVTYDPALASQNVTAAYRLTVPDIDHQVASPFWEFLNSSGPVIINGQESTERLFEPWFYATGYPITEAYWADVKVGGTVRLVLMQCFERRCLTYTPGNPEGFLTEAGNVGQHYYTWRYEQIPNEGSTPTATAEPSATATSEPTATAIAEPLTDYTYVTRWGGQYTPILPLLYSTAIAVDAEGNFWVTDGDAASSRVVQFNKHGVYLRTLGSPGTGTAQFVQPHGVAVAADGSIFVADTGKHIIQKFSAEGAFVDQFGTSGFGDGQFDSPTAIAINNDIVYVADTFNHRIQYFNLDGGYLGQFGGAGTANGQFLQPHGLAFDAQGNIYVADTGNGRVQKFTSGGDYLSHFGSFGTGVAQFSSPWGIGVNAEGVIYVADGTFFRIQLFSPEGSYLTSWEDESRRKLSFKLGFALDSDGNVYVGNLGGVLKFTGSGELLYQVRDSRRGRFSMLSDVTVDNDGNLLVIDPYVDSPTITRYTPDGIPLDDYVFLSSGSATPDTPSVAVVNDAGEVYVVDSTTNVVSRYSADWGDRESWGTLGSDPGLFNMPLDITLDAGGNVYIADSGNNRIQKFDAEGTFLDQWGEFGAGDGQFNKLQSIAIHGDRLYAADYGNNRVQVFDLDGEYIGQWGSAGTEAGQLSLPSGVATDANGYVLVVEHGNNRVQVFTPDGESAGMFGSAGSGPGQLSGPLSITLDPDGYVYVTDIGNYAVHKFAPAP